MGRTRSLTSVMGCTCSSLLTAQTDREAPACLRLSVTYLKYKSDPEAPAYLKKRD